MGGNVVGLSVFIDVQTTCVRRVGQPSAADYHRLLDEFEALEAIERNGKLGRLYGEHLYRMAFAGEGLRQGVESALGLVAPGQPGRFRVRLDLDSEPPALQALCWEAIVVTSVHPSSPLGCLRTGGFYRHVARNGPDDERSGTIEPKVLAAITEAEKQPPVAPAAIADRPSHRNILADVVGAERIGFVEPPVSFARIRECFLVNREQPYNVLHLVAPGGTDEEGPFILLEGDLETGPEKLRAGRLERFVVEEAPDLSLVVLIADHSADCSRTEPQRGFGLQVSSRGPAVVAVRGSMAPDAAMAFERSFYGKLLRNGRHAIDHAVNWGRSQLAGPWSGSEATPVLFAPGEAALERFSPPVMPRLGRDDAYPADPQMTPPGGRLHEVIAESDLAIVQRRVLAYGLDRSQARQRTRSKVAWFRRSVWIREDDVRKVA